MKFKIHLLFIVRWLVAFLNSFRARYVPISFPWFRRQLVFDKKEMKLVHCHIRNYVDWITLRQVYFNEDYRLSQLARCDDLQNKYVSMIRKGDIPLIIDCGANIGLSVKYFQSEFACSHTVAVEISSENCGQIRKNVGQNTNVSVLNKAIASSNGRLSLIDPGLGHNAFRTEVCEDGKLEGITVPAILDMFDDKKPFIIKIDIEGGEVELFSKNTEWLSEFALIIVELHDWLLLKSSSSGPFLRAVSQLDRDFVICGENIFSIANDL